MKSHEEFLKQELQEKLILQKQMEAYLDKISEKYAKTKASIEQINSQQIEGCIDLCYRYYLIKREKTYDKEVQRYRIRCEALECECGLLDKHLKVIKHQNESQTAKDKTSKSNMGAIKKEQVTITR